eukprot:PhM_4_TR16082/c0_g1_i1/m.38294
MSDLYDELGERCESDLKALDALQKKIDETDSQWKAWQQTLIDDLHELQSINCHVSEDCEDADDDDDDPVDEWMPEAVIAKKTSVKRGEVYYRVKWRHRNAITWEPLSTLENVNRSVILQFEQRQKEHAMTSPKKKRPVVYVSRRAKLRCEADGHSSGGLFAGLQSPLVRPVPTDRTGPTYNTGAIWSCEVEPFVWIPYDLATNDVLERAHSRGDASVSIQVSGRDYVVNLIAMTQGNAHRRVQRVIPRTEAEERTFVNSLSLEELRRYVASIRDFTPEHYEVLERLAELDKVSIKATMSQLDMLVPVTFEFVLNQVLDAAEGVPMPSLGEECLVCLEEFDMNRELCILPSCQHVYHYDCIMQYFSKYSKYCPVCKVAV